VLASASWCHCLLLPLQRFCTASRRCPAPVPRVSCLQLCSGSFICSIVPTALVPPPLTPALRGSMSAPGLCPLPAGAPLPANILAATPAPDLCSLPAGAPLPASILAATASRALGWPQLEEFRGTATCSHCCSSSFTWPRMASVRRVPGRRCLLPFLRQHLLTPKLGFRFPRGHRCILDTAAFHALAWLLSAVLCYLYHIH